jgi:hypothetical protein
MGGRTSILAQRPDSLFRILKEEASASDGKRPAFPVCWKGCPTHLAGGGTYGLSGGDCQDWGTPRPGKYPAGA